MRPEYSSAADQEGRDRVRRMARVVADDSERGETYRKVLIRVATLVLDAQGDVDLSTGWAFTEKPYRRISLYQLGGRLAEEDELLFWFRDQYSPTFGSVRTHIRMPLDVAKVILDELGEE